MTLLAAAAMMTAAACMGPGGSGSQETPSPKPTRTVAAIGAQDPKATAPAAEVPGAILGGTITVSSGTSPDTLDPTRASSPDARAILNLVTRGLTQCTRRRYRQPTRGTGFSTRLLIVCHRRWPSATTRGTGFWHAQ